MVRAPGRNKHFQWNVIGPKKYVPLKEPPRALQMITRAEWCALPAQGDPPGERLKLPIGHIRYTFTCTETCKNPDDCIPLVQKIQKEFMDKGEPDIMYNFLVGSDGVLYEGRGWDYKCSKMDYYVDSPGESINIAYIGTFFDVLAPWRMRLSTKHFEKWGLYNHLMTEDMEVTPSILFPKEGRPVTLDEYEAEKEEEAIAASMQFGRLPAEDDIEDASSESDVDNESAKSDVENESAQSDVENEPSSKSEEDGEAGE